jgi:hypothetical protein
VLQGGVLKGRVTCARKTGSGDPVLMRRESALWRDGIDLQPLHPRKRLAMVREHGQPVVKACHGDQQVKVADEVPGFSQMLTLSPEDPATPFVDAQHRDIFKNASHACWRCSGSLESWLPS